MHFFTQDYLEGNGESGKALFSLLNTGLSTKKRDQYGNSRFPPNYERVKSHQRPALIDENGQGYLPNPSKVFKPFSETENFLKNITLKDYRESKLEVKIEEIPNDVSNWLRKINWDGLQRRVWLQWLRAPEVRVVMAEQTAGEISAMMYEYFVEAATAEALR